MSIFDQIKRKLTPEKKEESSPLKVIRLETVDSTNNFLRNYTPEEGERMTIVVAEEQLAGRGQGSHTWESERGKNLTFSILTHPDRVPLRNQFLLSEAGALAIKMALAEYVTDDITLKWPNDIYWKDKKLSGTLIETKISSGHIKDCIFGVGLNVNQSEFHSDAPNPVSLCQIVGHELDREEILQKVIKAFCTCYALIEKGGYNDISALYHDALYRKHGFYPYEDQNGAFEAAIVEVEDNGHLILRDRQGEIREYEFQEIKYGKI